MQTLLEAENIRVEFKGLVAVDDVSFSLAGGQLLGLVGPNGAGKTTLMRVLGGLMPPTSGTARVMGEEVLSESVTVRREIGFAPDSPPAYEDIELEKFLRFVGYAYRMNPVEVEERIDFWLDSLWLRDKRGVKIGSLSRGMRQRVTLARIFLPQPHVMLLDEPLSGLDPQGRVQLREVLKSLRDQGCAMIVSSHILSDLEEVSTHIAILEHGSLLRFAETASLHDAGNERTTYELTVMEGLDGALTTLAGNPLISQLEQTGRRLVFEYDVSEAAAAELLRSLILSGVHVSRFTERKLGLEQAYIKAGLRQVD